MNTYRVNFTAPCPVNGEHVAYSLVIETDAVVMAEALVQEVDRLATDGALLHEGMADQLHSRFGGKQWLVATHDRVTIETDRP